MEAMTVPTPDRRIDVNGEREAAATTAQAQLAFLAGLCDHQPALAAGQTAFALIDVLRFVLRCDNGPEREHHHEDGSRQ